MTTTQEVWCDIEWYAGGYAGTNRLLGGSAHFYTCMQCEATPILMHHNCVSMEMHELMHPKSRSRILHLQANWGYQLSSNSNHLAQSYPAPVWSCLENFFSEAKIVLIRLYWQGTGLIFGLTWRDRGCSISKQMRTSGAIVGKYCAGYQTHLDMHNFKSKIILAISGFVCLIVTHLWSVSSKLWLYVG